MKSSLIVSELSEVLQNIQEIEMLLLVGLNRSLFKGRIDLLMGCIDGDINKQGDTVESLLKKHWIDGKFFLCDDSVRFELPDGCGGVAICDPTHLICQILKWIGGENLEGQHRTWATGYWMPEALCGDLATAESLHDPKEFYLRIREMIVPYPVLLSEAIREHCKEEIEQKLNILKNLPEKNNSIEFNLCLSDLIASLVRIAFAQSRCYFRGFKFLSNQVCFLEPSVLPIYEIAILLSQFKYNDIKEVKIIGDKVYKLLSL